MLKNRRPVCADAILSFRRARDQAVDDAHALENRFASSESTEPRAQTTVAPRSDACVAMEANDAVDPRFAELRSKYDETTRLLSAQCDTIERLQARILSLIHI